MTPRWADRFLRTIVLLAALLAIRPTSAVAMEAETPASRAFLQRVQQYIKLQKSVPRLRNTKQRKEIVERRRVLTQKIQEARSNAKPGDVFTPDVTEEFGRVIRTTFQGTGARNVRQTIQQGEPVAGWHPSVNAVYPDDLPTTTVPPTLLLRLPQLPMGVAYRIVGHDFVLVDTDARLIVDFVPGLVP